LENYETASTTKVNQQDRKKRTSMKTACTSRIAFLNPRVLIRFALYAAGLVLAFAPMSSSATGNDAAAELSQSAPAQAPGRWRATGDLVTARYLHTATLLPNGQVLVAGGNSQPGSAELYDPATGSWTATKNLHPWRWEHTATLLHSGNVLVSGGAARPFSQPRVLALAQLYKSAPEMLEIQ
jgi:hypothetical protein